MATVPLDQLHERVMASRGADIAVQGQILEDITTYLTNIPDFPVRHYFCGDDKTGDVVMYCLTLLSSFTGEAHDYFLLLYKKVTKSLETCTDCVSNFQKLRAKWRKEFLLKRDAPYDLGDEMVKNFTSAHSDGFIERVLAALNEGNYPVVVEAFIQCLINPQLMRQSDVIKNYFFTPCFVPIVLERPELKQFLKIWKIFPGLFYCLINGNDTQREWALQQIPYGRTHELYKVEDFNDVVMEEYERHFYHFQARKDFLEDECAVFWNSMIPIIASCESSTIENRLLLPDTYKFYEQAKNVKVATLTVALMEQAFCPLDVAFPFLLRALALFLNKLKEDFYPLIKPHGYLNFFDIAFKNPNYDKYLSCLNPDEDGLTEFQRLHSSVPLFSDMINWINADYESTHSAGRSQIAIITFRRFGDLMGNPNYGVPVGNLCMELMTRQLAMTLRNGDPKLTDVLIRESNARAILDNKAITIFDAFMRPELRQPAMHLLAACLVYDITLLGQYTTCLRAGDASVSSQFFHNLWNLLQGKIAIDDTEFASIVLGSFKEIIPVYKIDIALTKTLVTSQPGYKEDKLRELIGTSNKQNRNIIAFDNSVEKVFNRLSEMFQSSSLKTILSNKEASVGFWSCILSPEEKIYESSAGFLNEAFNVDDRYDSFREVLKLNMPLVLNSFSRGLDESTRNKLFPASERTVKILMDFVISLFDPIHGMVIDVGRRIDDSSKSALSRFWKSCWIFLRKMYINTFTWANQYEKLKAATIVTNTAQAEKISKDLLEFTRDVLDLSRSLLSGYKLLVNMTFGDDPPEEEQKKVKAGLFESVTHALEDVLSWLKLSDPALLERCVELIKTVLDLSLELQLDVGKETLKKLIYLCTKTRKNRNKMSKEQIGELTLRARKFDDKLVDDIFAEAEEYKRSKEVVGVVSSRESSVEPIKLIKSESAAGTSKKQHTLSNFLTKAAIKETTPAAAKRLSALELANLKLAEKRKASTAPPAPARPAGFNRKKNADDSDSESENGSDSDDGALFTREQVVEKMKKSKMALSSLQHGRFANSRLKASPNPVNQKKKAEELMRLRLNVDMNPLYRNVLTWSYEKGGDFPVDSDNVKYSSVGDTFESAAEYQKTFEPLLLLECWQSIQRAKQLAEDAPFRITIGSRSATDSFFDVYASVKKDVVSERKLVNDNDLVALILNEYLPEGDKPLTRKHIKKFKYACFAKVRDIKSHPSGYADITLRVATSTPLLSCLSPGSELACVRVIQMTTIEREFSSLKGLQYYDLFNQIIKAVPSSSEKLSSEKIEEMKRLYDVNSSQATAIAGTVRNKGFSLIQGPPGTGKTKTILGIVGYVLTNAAHQPAQVILQPGQKTDPAAQSKKKILICAPSNAAVDELVSRLMGGIKDSKGTMFKPKVVRLGRSDAINAQVKETTLEELVEAQIATAAKVDLDDNSIREQHRQCISERDSLRSQLSSGKLSQEQVAKTELKLQEVIQKRKELGKRLDEIREQRAVSYRNREIEKRNIQFKILNDAQVICSTLSGSAHKVLAGMSMTFDTVVIDEAAQCIELSALIPLRYGCQKCIMVGDPNQLPPTVLSQKAASYNYEQSLFVRMQNNYSHLVYLLDVQYRMHPTISRFPSKQFYNSRLLDGPGMDVKNTQPWHAINELGPYRFFNIKGEHQQNQRSMSLYNVMEAQIAVELVQKLFDSFDMNFSAKIGVISPYKEQIRVLRNLFSREFGQSVSKKINFNTVDGFQGQEKEIVIFSCVRAGENQTKIGFVADIRRMNVALTRARSSLWILGSEPVLTHNKTWKALIEDAHERNLVSDVQPGFTKSLHNSGIIIPQSSSGTKREAPTLEATSKPKKQKSGYLPPAPAGLRKNLAPVSSGSMSPRSSKPSRPVPKNSGTIPAIPTRKLPTAPSRSPLLVNTPLAPSASGTIPPPSSKSLHPPIVNPSADKYSKPSNFRSNSHREANRYQSLASDADSSNSNVNSNNETEISFLNTTPPVDNNSERGGRAGRGGRRPVGPAFGEVEFVKLGRSKPKFPAHSKKRGGHGGPPRR